MKLSYVALCLLGMVSYTEAQFDAKRCDTYLDCPSTLCCGTATPQIARYGTVHKICYRPGQTLYMNYNGYKFDFACDPLPVEETPIIDPNPKQNDLSEFNASWEQYEKRFWYNYNPDDPENIPGYGVNKPWVPPISEPDSLITIYDRYLLSGDWQSWPIILGAVAWAEGFGNADSWDGYWYANKEASGSQLYPTGLSKYFDLHSIDGLTTYTFHWLWDVVQHLAAYFTLLIPIDVWIAWLNGASLDGFWKLFLFYEPFSALGLGIPSLWASYFKVEMEDGWGILLN